MSLPDRVREFLSNPHPGEPARPLLGEEDRLIVAVSGGSDSLALLHLLADQNLHPAANLLVVHLDHGLRPTSAEDAAYVRDRAQTLGVRCITDRQDVRAKALSEGMTLEEAGRKARYAFLAMVAKTEGAPVVATGHTADDQAETILMNLLRGSGPRGLRGILPVGNLPGSNDILLARPLLTTTRQEIETYCAAHDLSPIEDKTNLDPAYYRNWIRLELLPKIDERLPGVKERLRQTAEIVTADYELLDGILGDTWSFLVIDSGPGWLRLDLSVWRVLPTSLRRSTLRKAVSLARSDEADIGFRTIELARKVAQSGGVGSEATLPDGVRLTVGYDDLLIAGQGVRAPAVDLPQLPSGAHTILPVPGSVALTGNWVLGAKVIDQIELSEVFGNIDPWRAFISLPEPAELVVRPANEGERFQPLGLDGHSASVQDVMVNRKISSASRSRWPVVASPDHLVWLAGHQVDHRARVTDGRGAVIQLSVERAG
ncbi:MAG: tRNA lysidine(34) synthetase TilS [Candidatus Promineifilaceae bacterium]